MRTAEEIEREYDPKADWAKYEEWAEANHDTALVVVTKKTLVVLLAMRDELRERDAEFDREVARRVKHLMQDRAEWGGFADNEAAEKLAIFANPTERWAFVEQSAWERIAATRTPDAAVETP